jgi:serpin B
VLTNAIYFKGTWKWKFDAKKTEDAEFTLASKKTVETSLMYQRGNFAYNAYESMQVIELPYGAGDISMFVILPEKADGLSDIEKQLSPEKLGEWTSKMINCEVDLYLPKFKLTQSVQLDETLKAMGMPTAFSRNEADFSGISSIEPLFISKVVHKAFIDVNEAGTEAAASTAVIGAKGGPVDFRADHPFLYFIRDNRTGSILFLGRVMNPNE